MAALRTTRVLRWVVTSMLLWGCRDATSAPEPRSQQVDAGAPPVAAKQSLRDILRGLCVSSNPDVAPSCFTGGVLSFAEKRTLATELAALAPSPRRTRALEKLLGTGCGAGACTREDLLAWAFGASSPGLDDPCPWLKAWCDEAPPSRTIAGQCVAHPGCFSHATWLSLVDFTARESSTGATNDPYASVLDGFIDAVVDETPPHREEMLRRLVSAGRLSAEGAARVPTRSELDARVDALLRRRKHRISDVCEDDLRLVREAPRGTLVLEATGNRCGDGPYLEVSVTLGSGGYRLVRALERHTGRP